MNQKIINSADHAEAVTYALREGKHANRDAKKRERNDERDKDEREHKKNREGNPERDRSKKNSSVQEKSKDSKDRKECEIIGGNMDGRTAFELAREFGLSRNLRRALRKAVFHVSLSLKKGEKLTDEQWCKLVAKYMARMGFKHCQYVIIKHGDKAHEHVHVIASRIRLTDGRAVPDSKSYRRGEEICRQLEKEFNLSRGVPSREATRRAQSQGEKAYTERTGRPSVRVRLQSSVDLAIKDKPSLKVFVERLNGKGIEVLQKLDESKKVLGLSFKLDGIAMRGRSLGKAYSWPQLQQRGVSHEHNREDETRRDWNKPGVDHQGKAGEGRDQPAGAGRDFRGDRTGREKVPGGAEPEVKRAVSTPAAPGGVERTAGATGAADAGRATRSREILEADGARVAGSQDSQGRGGRKHSGDRLEDRRTSLPDGRHHGKLRGGNPEVSAGGGTDFQRDAKAPASRGSRVEKNSSSASGASGRKSKNSLGDERSAGWVAGEDRQGGGEVEQRAPNLEPGRGRRVEGTLARGGRDAQTVEQETPSHGAAGSGALDHPADRATDHAAEMANQSGHIRIIEGADCSQLRDSAESHSLGLGNGAAEIDARPAPGTGELSGSGDRAEPERGRTEGVNRPDNSEDINRLQGLEQAFRILGIEAEVGLGIETELSRSAAILELVGAGRKDLEARDSAQDRETIDRDMVANTYQDQREKAEIEVQEQVRPESNRSDLEKSPKTVVEIVLEL
jgi:Relaxase/Mobilisation nuclease domain